jgi:alpha-L-arabinofuranosidase
MSMYANLLEACVVELDLASGQLTKGDDSEAVVDAVATVDGSGKQWSIALVNRHPSEDVSCTVTMKDRSLEGAYKATILAGDSTDAYNDIKSPDRVAPVFTGARRAPTSRGHKAMKDKRHE